MGSGGGKTQTTSSGIDAECKPYLKEVLADATGQYKRQRDLGPDATVAGDVAEQKEALAAGQTLGRDLSQGISQQDIQRQLQNVQGQQLGAQQGSLGSARASRARESALADQAIGLQQASDQRRAQGAQTLAAIGQERQAKSQARLDAPHTAAERYFGYLGSAPQQQTTSAGGGK